MNRDVNEILAEALLHFDAATAYSSAGHADDDLVADAMCMRLYAGLEALTRLPDDVAHEMFPGAWPDMRAMRHRIAHGYRTVSLKRVRDTVMQEIPDAIASIRSMLA